MFSGPRGSCNRPTWVTFYARRGPPSFSLLYKEKEFHQNDDDDELRFEKFENLDR